FLHGLSRGYTLAETIGEKWVEGGVLQWKGLRGGTREAAYRGGSTFSLCVELEIRDGNRLREAHYDIEVRLHATKPPRVCRESLMVAGRGQYIFDSHPKNDDLAQGDPMHLTVRLKKKAKEGYKGRQIAVLSDRPALSQIPSHPDARPKEVRD